MIRLKLKINDRTISIAGVSFSECSQVLETQPVHLNDANQKGLFVIRTGRAMCSLWSFQTELANFQQQGLNDLQLAMADQKPVFLEVTVGTAAESTWRVLSERALVVGVRLLDLGSGQIPRVQFDLNAERISLDVPEQDSYDVSNCFVPSTQQSFDFEIVSKNVKMGQVEAKVTVCEFEPTYWARSVSRKTSHNQIKVDHSRMLRTPDLKSVSDYISYPVDASKRDGRTVLQEQMKQVSDVISIEFFVAANMSKSFEASTGSDLAKDVERFLMTLMYWPAENQLGAVNSTVISTKILGVEGAFGGGGPGTYKLPELHPTLRLPKQLFKDAKGGLFSGPECFGILPQIVSTTLPDGGKCWMSPFQVQVEVVSFDPLFNPYLIKVRLDAVSHREWQVMQ